MPVPPANSAPLSATAISASSASSAKLRRIFERRAATFDDVNFLPREIAGRMRERLDYIKVAPSHILDAGCGTGSDLAALAIRYPESQVMGVDLAAAMLRRAATVDTTASDGWSRWLPDSMRRLFGRRRPWLAQADFAALPLASGTFDILWSNLALQWHPRPDQVFPEWQRVLAVGGLLMFSTLGPDTLKELRLAWREAAAACDLHRLPPILDFVDMHDFGDMLVASGFELPVMDMEMLTITYREPAALLADVKGWGADARGARSLADGGLPPGLAGRRMRDALHDALARQRRADGTIALTFEIVYGHAWKAQPRSAPGETVIPLDAIGGRRQGPRSRP